MEGEAEDSKVHKMSSKKVIRKRTKPKPKPEVAGDTSASSMPKKDLQIEVIEHPEADSHAEQVAVGDGSEYIESEPQQESAIEEPNQREGTLGPQDEPENEGEEYEVEYEEEEEEQEHPNNHEYVDSMDDRQPKQSLQSFGQDSGRKNQPDRPQDEDNEGAGGSKIQAHHFNEFMQKKGQDHDRDMREDQQQPSDQAQSDNLDDAENDDEMIKKQQQEAEALLQEAADDEELEEIDQISQEGEEDEIEENQKLANENKYEDPEVDNDPEPEAEENKFSLNYTVGRIEDGAAILISKDHNLIEIPL